MCRYFPTDPGNVGADCPVENENDDSEGEGDDGISDDDGDFTDTNPLEIYQKDAPEGMSPSKPRYTRVNKKKVPNEAMDYSTIANKQCKNRAKAFDRYCHDFKGKGKQQFRDYRNTSG